MNAINPIPIISAIATVAIMFAAINENGTTSSVVIYLAPLPLMITALKWEKEYTITAVIIITVALTILTAIGQLNLKSTAALAILILPIPIIIAATKQKYERNNLNYRHHIEKNITSIIPLIIPINSLLLIFFGELSQQNVTELLNTTIQQAQNQNNNDNTTQILNQTINYIRTNPLVFVTTANVITTITAHLNLRLAILIIKNTEKKQKWSPFQNINVNPILIAILALAAALTKTTDPIAIAAAVTVGAITATVILSGIAFIHKKLHGNKSKKPILIILYATLITFPIIIIPVIFTCGLVNTMFNTIKTSQKINHNQ